MAGNRETQAYLNTVKRLLATFTPPRGTTTVTHLALGDGEELQAAKVAQPVTDHAREAALAVVGVIKLPLCYVPPGIPGEL